MDVPRSPIFDGLSAGDLDAIVGLMSPHRFAVGDIICREGDAGASLFLIRSGLAQVAIGPSATGGRRPLARMRPGDVIGEVSLLTGEPRSATVEAILPTDVLELSHPTFAAILANYPRVRENLNHILSQRLVRTSAQLAGRRLRGEVVGLFVGPHGASLTTALIGATRSASPKSVSVLAADVDGRSADEVLGALNSLVAAHDIVLVILDSQRPDTRLLAEHMDRTVGLLTAVEAARLAVQLGPAAERLELALLTEHRSEPEVVGTGQMRIVRSVELGDAGAGTAWLGRHLSRTKLGLALGAGGAKGYAHVAALQVLEGAGYVVDYVTGSSIGAIVGCWLGNGMNADQIEATLRREHTPESVAAMFKLAFSGLSTGLPVMTEMCLRTTDGRSFEQLQIPVGVMTVDLDLRQPLLLTHGPLWQALLAATALPGMFPPYEHEGRRLIDAMALVPVPSDAARDLGADVVVSVNLSSRDTLPTWPGELPPRPAAARPGVRLLDSLLEVMDLAQLDSSVRHAARADVALTPRFGPCSWRDYHLADQFLAAGRAAAEAQLEALARIARPQAKAFSINITEPERTGYDPTATVHV